MRPGVVDALGRADRARDRRAALGRPPANWLAAGLEGAGMLFMVVERFKNAGSAAHLPPPARRGPRPPGGPALRRQLGRAELRPLLPGHGVRRRLAAAAVGAALGRPGRVRDHPGRDVGRDARGRRATPLVSAAATAAPPRRARARRRAARARRCRGGARARARSASRRARVLRQQRAVHVGAERRCPARAPS